SAEDSPSLFIVAVVDAVIDTASAATRAASEAFCEISRIEAPISSLPEETVATLREICSAAADTVCACAVVSSADEAICAATPDICSDAAASDVADPLIVEMVARR